MPLLKAAQALLFFGVVVDCELSHDEVVLGIVCGGDGEGIIGFLARGGRAGFGCLIGCG